MNAVNLAIRVRGAKNYPLLTLRATLPQGRGNTVSCAKHTVMNLFIYSPIHLNIVIQRTKSEESHVKESFRCAQDDRTLYPLPLGEREELLCERSVLSNSSEGCKELPSPDATRHPPPREGKYSFVCEAYSNELIHLFTYFPIYLFRALPPHPKINFVPSNFNFNIQYPSFMLGLNCLYMPYSALICANNFEYSEKYSTFKSS